MVMGMIGGWGTEETHHESSRKKTILCIVNPKVTLHQLSIKFGLDNTMISGRAFELFSQDTSGENSLLDV